MKPAFCLPASGFKRGARAASGNAPLQFSGFGLSGNIKKLFGKRPDFWNHFDRWPRPAIQQLARVVEWQTRQT